MIEENKFETERKEILSMMKKGIKSNIPLKPVQKKYIKNLLFFSLIRASKNQSVTKKNFIKLVIKQFKKYIVKTINNNMKKMPNYNPDEDEEFYDDNLEVDINNIIANEQLLEMNNLQQVLTPANIMNHIKSLVEKPDVREIMKQIMAMREINSNQRETPDQARLREQRQREYQRQKQHIRIRQYERGGRSR